MKAAQSTPDRALRVLFVQDQLRIGGTERQTLFLARFMRDRGHQPRLLLFAPGGRLFDEVSALGLPTEVLQSRDWRLPLLAPGLMRAVERSGCEIVLAMGRTANCYAGFVQRRFPEKAVVGTLRTGKRLFPLHHWSVGRVRAMLVNTHWWKRRLLERGCAEERVHVVHNPALLEYREDAVAADRERLRAAEGVGLDACVLLNVATFRKGKRHAHLLRLLASWRKREPDRAWVLWLVGEGTERRRCERWVAENGLGTRVRFFGYRPDPAPFYAAADIAVSTSMEDSLPNFLVEAQAMALPLVAFDCRGVVECCDPGRSGFVLPPGDEAGFCAALARLMDHPDHRREAGSAALEVARERFSPLRQAAAAEAFLISLRPAAAG